MRYRPDIDGLRAIAVLLVVVFHAFPNHLAGGFVGVDVFFVISGFLITSLLLAQLQAGQFSLVDFYSRRARRILPALCLVLLTCLAFGFIVLLPDELVNLGRHMAAAAAFAANLSLWRDSGYFAPASQFQPLLHLWSLGIEEQFYLVWPLLAAFAWRRRYYLLPIVLLLTAASFAGNLRLTHLDATAAFYFPLSRFWELGLGCLLAIAKADSSGARAAAPNVATASLQQRIAACSPWIGLGLIGSAMLTFDRSTAFPGFAALIPVAGALAILAQNDDSWLRRRVLASRPLVFIGLISYPLYLWHWPLLSFEAILNSGKPHALYRVAAVVLSVVLATLTYRFLELPIRQRRGASVGIGLAAAAGALGVFGCAVVLHRGLPSRFPAAVSAMRQAPRQDDRCLESVNLNSEFNYCKRTRSERPDIVFLGDSQAQGVYEGTVSALGNRHSLLLLGRGGCPPGLNVNGSAGVYVSEDRRVACNETWASFVEYIRETRPSLVVLVGDGSQFFPSTEEGTGPAVEEKPAAFRQGLNDLVTSLEPYSRVAYVLEIPTFETAPACFLRPLKLPGSRCTKTISRHTLVRSRASYAQSVNEIRSQHSNMFVVDPIPSLCGSNACSQTSHGGDVLYSDQMHLSPAGGRRFAYDSGFARLIDQTARQGPIERPPAEP